MVLHNPKVIVILGPTACGKTALAVDLARKYNGEIISADSRQVYRGMNIGTGKDLSEYGDVPYRLIDIVEPAEQFTVAEYQKLAYTAIDDIISRGKTPILCGGTGLYISAVVQGYQLPATGELEEVPGEMRAELEELSLDDLLSRLAKVDRATYDSIDKKNRRRVQRALEMFYQTGVPKSEQIKKQTPPYEFLQIGVMFPKTELDQRIKVRLDQRLKQGMVSEVEKLHARGVSWERLDEFGLEYRFIAQHLQGNVSYEEMVDQLCKAICQFAKRQMTWFKRDKTIHWIQNHQQAIALAGDWLKAD